MHKEEIDRVSRVHGKWVGGKVPLLTAKIAKNGRKTQRNCRVPNRERFANG